MAVSVPIYIYIYIYIPAYILIFVCLLQGLGGGSRERWVEGVRDLGMGSPGGRFIGWRVIRGEWLEKEERECSSDEGPRGETPWLARGPPKLAASIY